MTDNMIYLRHEMRNGQLCIVDQHGRELFMAESIDLTGCADGTTDMTIQLKARNANGAAQGLSIFASLLGDK